MTDDAPRPPRDARDSAVPALVENLFRHAYGRLVSRLARHLGPARLDHAEDAVQHAMIQALRTWPFRGTPETPEAWLYAAARNRAVDLVRRDLRAVDAQGSDIEPALPTVPAFPGEVTDDLLRLIFVCCHPTLPQPAQLALTLKTVCGLGTTEIARAFLVSEVTIQQRVVRAKRRLKDPAIRFEIPDPDHLPTRLDSVLHVLYLMFNEAYAASDGDRLIRRDLAEEALRLTGALLDNPRTESPAGHALAALMHLHAARFDARIGPDGMMTLLADQDRDLWDAERLERGLYHLGRSRSAGTLTRYHCEAGIGAAHAASRSGTEPDWSYIVDMYDVLERIAPSPVVALNRAVAVGMRDGPAAGLDLCQRLERTGALGGYRLLAVVQGRFSMDLGRHRDAERYFRAALAMPSSEPERKLLEARLKEAKDANQTALQ